MSAEMLLVFRRPRARITRDFQRGTYVALYDDGLEFRTPGKLKQTTPERPQFGNDKHASIARLLEVVGSMECPECARPLARDVWQSIELAAGHKMRCRQCETRIRIEEKENVGLIALRTESEVLS